MSDFVYSKKGVGTLPLTRFKQLYTDADTISPLPELTLTGNKKNIIYVQKESAFIIIMGYCYHLGESITTMASRLLDTFDESMIKELKYELNGQFIIIIKKHNYLYFFSDCMQVGNLYYSKDFSVITSCFSVVEEGLGTDKSDLDFYKVFEYVAMRNILYPSWLGSGTMHKNIKRLRPYEYIIIDLINSTNHIHEVKFAINNEKEKDIHKISTGLMANLKSVIENPDFKDDHVAVTLTGGYDTRLISVLASNYFKNATFRISSSKISKSKQLDTKIAKKIARSIGKPLKIYQSNNTYKDAFYLLTEGMSPQDNSHTAPVIEDNGSFSLGMGGCFGTELFAPLDYTSIEDFIERSVLKAQRNIKADQVLWDTLRSSIKREFEDISKHYQLAVNCPNDEIRIFNLFCTSFLASHIVWPFNIKGLEFEPYMSMRNLELALRLTTKQFGKRTNFTGMGEVQKIAMAQLCYSVGKINTTHYGPMVPCTLRSFWSYLFHYFQHVTFSLNYRITSFMGEKKLIKATRNTVNINDLSYISNGWDSLFLRRLSEKYGLDAKVK